MCKQMTDVKFLHCNIGNHLTVCKQMNNGKQKYLKLFNCLQKNVNLV